MTALEKSELVFCVWTDSSDRGYPQTYVRIWRAYRENVAEVREGTVGNKAGYGSDDGARYWLGACEKLEEGGHEIVYRSSSCYGPEIKIRWQHFEGTGFCAPDFENLGRGYSEIKLAMATIEKIGRRIEKLSLVERRREYEHASLREVRTATFDNPHDLVAALRAMKVVEVEAMKVGPESWHTVHVPKRARPVEYTLTNVSSPGMAVSA